MLASLEPRLPGPGSLNGNGRYRSICDNNIIIMRTKTSVDLSAYNLLRVLALPKKGEG